MIRARRTSPGQRRVRPERLAILLVGFVCTVGLLGAIGWSCLQALGVLAQPVLASLQPSASLQLASGTRGDWRHSSAWSTRTVDTSAFEAMVRRDFSSSASPSVLYFNPFDDLALLLMSREAEASYVKNALASTPRLLPILDASEDASLRSKLEQLFAEYPGSRFVPHLYVYNPQNHSYVDINGDMPVPAASVIKLPILLEYLTRLDQRDMAPDMPIFYADKHRAGGAGILQYMPTGIELAANDVAGQMIRISDNTCTNMMIDSLGGTNAVNRQLSYMGLVRTRLRNWLPDLEGSNTISSYEMATILYNLDDLNLLSPDARANGLDILKSTHNRRLLVTPLPPDAIVAHKTGDIGTSLGDSGIVYMPDGRKFIVSIQIERPFNDYTARDMVQRASRLIYDHVAQTTIPPIFANAQSTVTSDAQ